MYIWENTDWPSFSPDESALVDLLKNVYHERGMLLGRMQALGFPLRQQASLSILSQEIQKTSEIEGESLNLAAVRSSLGRRLGIDPGESDVSDALSDTVSGAMSDALTDTVSGAMSGAVIDGIVNVLADATQRYQDPLSIERLFSWHRSLFPTGRSGLLRIQTGDWRGEERDPMQVVSGALGKETIHYEAPPAERIPSEIKRFLTWYNASETGDEIVHALLAHLWFVTIHPFEDGNGRMGRAILEMSMARAEKSSLRFFSLSHQIEKERDAYYRILQQTQSGELTTLEYVEWFLRCLLQAFEGSYEILSSVLFRARFWNRFATEALNERQIRMINRLLDDFKGNMTSSKWAKMTESSQDTAHRDIKDLIERGILIKSPAGGRSTTYSLVVL